MRYKYSKKVGALQEGMSEAQAPDPSSLPHGQRASMYGQEVELDTAVQSDVHEQLVARSSHATTGGTPTLHAQALAPPAATVTKPLPRSDGLDPVRSPGGTTMFHYMGDEGQRVLMIKRDGTTEEIAGPRRVWRLGRRFQHMPHYVAHPGEFLIVRRRDGGQQHIAGPADMWLDQRKHVSATKEESLQLASKEAVVAYRKDDAGEVKRRVVHGPATFVPQPGEWLHTFSWHGSRGGPDGYRKVPNALVFQKLWLMPDQMYHDVTDVRTADDAVLTIRLMMFFELADIETMLDTTHDPIGDFVNAASSDVVDLVARHDFDSFKRNTDQLNELQTYKQLVGRAEQCGYQINKVVYRGYGLPASLQEMHDQAIESRTRLQLERATETQAQELEDYKLDRDLSRAAKRRQEKGVELDADIELARKRQEQDLRASSARGEFTRTQRRADADLEDAIEAARKEELRQHFAALKKLGVDLTAYLTQTRADQVIELRGDNSQTPHVHLPAPESNES